MAPVDSWAAEALAQLDRAGLRRALEPLQSPQGPVVQVGGQSLINFSSNDYLSLASDPRVREAAVRAVAQHGVGSGASRLLVGDSAAHQALEAELAQFLSTEAALLFNSGYAANVGLLSTLVGEGDVVFSDALNHASLIDGCRLSRAQTVVYPHGDVERLAELMALHRGRRQLICTDTVFSMDGDLAPLRALHALATQREAALVVDEAHAVGVLGPSGAGLVEAFGLSVDVRMGTLGKALGSFGAFVGTSAATREWLFNKARSLVFSTALPPAVCAAALEALRVVRTDGGRRLELWRNIERFAAGLRRLLIPAQGSSAIFSVVYGAPERALEASRLLRRRGILAKAIRPPTVPPGTSRVRFALTAGHTEAQVDLALEALEELKVKHGLTRAA